MIDYGLFMMIYKPSKLIYSSVHIDRVYNFIRDHFSRIPLYTYISFNGPVLLIKLIIEFRPSGAIASISSGPSHFSQLLEATGKSLTILFIYSFFIVFFCFLLFNTTSQRFGKPLT